MWRCEILEVGLCDVSMAKKWLNYTPGSTNIAGWKWTRIEDVFPSKNGDIPACYVIVYQAGQLKDEKIGNQKNGLETWESRNGT